MLNDITYQIIYQKAIHSYKEQVMACVAHDFRSPLNGMLGKVKQIRDCSSNKTINLHADSMEKNIQLLNIYINDILDYS